MVPSAWRDMASWLGVESAWRMASTYIGLLMILLTLTIPETKRLLFPLSVLVCFYGIVETLQREMPTRPTLLSVAGHVMLPLLCVTDGSFPVVGLDGIYTAAGTLLFVLGVYVAHPNSWPYELNMRSSVALTLSLTILLLT